MGFWGWWWVINGFLGSVDEFGLKKGVILFLEKFFVCFNGFKKFFVEVYLLFWMLVVWDWDLVNRFVLLINEVLLLLLLNIDMEIDIGFFLGKLVFWFDLDGV